MPLVRVDHEFFRKERTQSYSEWKTAFWRELLQNSLDPGVNASVIKVDVTDTEEEKGCTVVFEDDGCGMTKQVLEDVYFCIGMTTKGEGSIGGFGRARLLTCFSMKSYEILTLDNKVTGSGSSYDIEDAPFFQGTRLTIHIPDAAKGTMIMALNNVLEKSNFNTPLVVNGTPAKAEADFGEFVSYQDFGAVYFRNEREFSGKLFVTVNGLWMFSVDITPPKHGFVQVPAEKSREVLTSNRDAFHDSVNASLMGFIHQLNTDYRASLPTVYEVRRVISHGGLRICAPVFDGSVSALTVDSERLPEETTIGSQTKRVFKKVFSVDGSMVVTDGNTAERNVTGEAYSSHTNEGTTYSAKEFLPDFGFYINTSNEELLKEAANWNPENWEFEIRGNRVVWLNGHQQLRLFLFWDHFVRLAVQTLAQEMNRTFYYSPGFCFDSSVLGMCTEMSEVPCILLSPLDENMKPRFDLRKRYWRKEILGIAIHEVAHLEESFHDEDYARVLTNLIKRFEFEEALSSCKELRL